MCDFTKIRALVVDDSSIWRGFVIGRLSNAGVTAIHVAYDGIQAVFKARTVQPDLILMDVSLPHMNGIEAAARIREVAPAARVVFVTSCSDPDVRRAALAAGGRAYVVKSLAGRQLVDAIKLALRPGP